MKISNQLEKMIVKFPFGFTVSQIVLEAETHNLSLTSQQISDYLYRSKNVLFDKRKRLYMYNPEQSQSQPITASLVKKALDQSLQNKLDSDAQQIAHNCLIEAKRGSNSIELEVPLNIHPSLAKLGFNLEVIDNLLTKITW